jgi:CHAT domain-containing protein
MDFKASLVVLSACETGLGKLSSGDELVGLTPAFIYVGTRLSLPVYGMSRTAQRRS